MHQTLSLLLAVAYPVVLVAGFYVAFRAKRLEAPRVSTAVWRQGAGAVAAPVAASAYPFLRVVLTFAGSTLLALGSLLPSSTLVRSAALSTPETGSMLYMLFAVIAVVLAATKRFRVLYLAGGIPLILLITVGIESTIMLQKYPAYAQQFYGDSYGLGWGWILMVAGSAVILFAAILNPAPEATFYKPPPKSAAVRRDPEQD